MAELTTPALRKIIRTFSKDAVLYSEMLSSGAIAARGKYNEPLIQQNESDQPFIYQIVGDSPDIMSAACEILSEIGCYSIDINMGCSAPDILKAGAGARLLSDLNLSRKIIQKCRKSAGTRLSVKMRSGFENSDEKNLVRFTAMLQGEGVDFIAIHPRHSKLGFTRSADWRLVRLLKEKLDIPVIGNGDIKSHIMAIDRLNETGCDAVMIGREAVTSPWIFRLCNELLNGTDSEIEIDIRNVFLSVLDNIKLFLPEKLHKSRGHRFCFYYSKNAEFSHELFTRIRKENTIDGMKSIIEGYYERNPPEAKKTFRAVEPGYARSRGDGSNRRLWSV